MNLDHLIDVANATQDRSLYWDEEIYNLEMEKLFGRCWLFLAHETHVPKAGDYIKTTMGEDEVIVVRQRDNSIKVFLNTCRHRGAQVCSAESGSARNFSCNYHGWTYGIDGALLLVPLEKELYGNALDKCKYGLREVAKVENYHGFIFGCFDPDAPSFRDYLGDMSWYVDSWMDIAGGVELIGPPSRSLLDSNWKIPSENFCGDNYHVGWTHGAALKSLGAKEGRAGNKRLPADGEGMQVTTQCGHGMGVVADPGPMLLGGEIGQAYMAYRKGVLAKVEERLGAQRAKLYGYHLNSTIFPNTSYLWGSNTFKVWQPRGPRQTEVMTWAIVEKDMPADLKEQVVRGMNRIFGTAGMLESDDTDNFETVSLLSRGFQTRRTTRLVSNMSQGREQLNPEWPGLSIEGPVSETCHRGYYRFYKELLGAERWSDIRVGDDYWKQELLGRPAA